MPQIMKSICSKTVIICRCFLHAAAIAGVSNFGLSEMQELLKLAKVKPAVLETRSDPFAINHHLINFCIEHNITFIGYSNLGTQWINSPAAVNPVITSNVLKVSDSISTLKAQPPEAPLVWPV